MLMAKGTILLAFSILSMFFSKHFDEAAVVFINHKLMKTDMANPLWPLGLCRVTPTAVGNLEKVLKSTDDIQSPIIEFSLVFLLFCFGTITPTVVFFCFLASPPYFGWPHTKKSTLCSLRIYYPLCGTLTLMAILPIRGQGCLAGLVGNKTSKMHRNS